jgi:hypothetical protein
MKKTLLISQNFKKWHKHPKVILGAYAFACHFKYSKNLNKIPFLNSIQTIECKVHIKNSHVLARGSEGWWE